MHEGLTYCRVDTVSCQLPTHVCTHTWVCTVVYRHSLYTLAHTLRFVTRQCTLVHKGEEGIHT